MSGSASLPRMFDSRDTMSRNPGLFVAAALAVAVITAAAPGSAFAQRRGPHRVVFVGGYFYDPFFGPYPWWGPAAYPYPYFPVYDERAQVRLQITPRDAAVYVDGYYAGVVDDFDGIFQSLPLTPGGHDIAVYLDGYRTVHQSLYLTRNKSYKLRYTLERLGAGEESEPPPAVPPVPPPPPGTAMPPRTPRAGAPAPGGFAPPPVAAASAARFGTLALRVQPDDAEVLIDGERWTPSQAGERLLVQLTGGRHQVEIRKPGYTSFTSEVAVTTGETTTLNVSLSSE